MVNKNTGWKISMLEMYQAQKKQMHRLHWMEQVISKYKIDMFDWTATMYHTNCT